LPLTLLLLVGGGDSLFAELGLDLSRELQMIIQQVTANYKPFKIQLSNLVSIGIENKNRQKHCTRIFPFNSKKVADPSCRLNLKIYVYCCI